MAPGSSSRGASQLPSATPTSTSEQQSGVEFEEGYRLSRVQFESLGESFSVGRRSGGSKLERGTLPCSHPVQAPKPQVTYPERHWLAGCWKHLWYRICCFRVRNLDGKHHSHQVSQLEKTKGDCASPCVATFGPSTCQTGLHCLNPVSK